MTHPPTRWELAGEGNRGYGAKFARLVEDGSDVEGEARLADVLVARNARILDIDVTDALDVDEQLALVRRMRAAHERSRDELRALHPDPEPAPDKRSPRRVLEWGIELNEFYVDWCDRVEREIEDERST